MIKCKHPSGWVVLLVFLMGLAIPLSLSALWHFKNQNYPTNDEGFFLEVSQHIYLVFRDFGWHRGVSAFYLWRSFKPLLHVSLVALFFPVSGGRVIAANAFASLTFYLLLLSFSFLLLRRYLSLGLSALAMLFIGTLPWILERSFGIGSEIPFLTAVTACLYFGLQVNNFSCKRNSVLCALCLGLAICCRPVEACLLFFPGLFFLLFDSVKKKTIGYRDIAIGLILVLALVFAFMIQVRLCEAKNCSLPTRLEFLALLAVVPILYLGKNRLKLQAACLYFYLCSFSIVVFWYAPFFYPMYTWIAQSTVGLHAQVTGGRLGQSVLFFLGKVYTADFGIFFAPLCLLTLLLRKKLENRASLVTLLAMTLLPLLVGSFSENADTRYYLASSLLMFFAFLVALLREGAKGRCFSIAIISLMSITQTLHAYGFLEARPLLPHSISSRLFAFVAPVLPGQSKIIQSAVDGFGKFLPQSKTLEICLMQMRQYNSLDWIYDPWALTLAAREQGLAWEFSRINPHLHSTTLESYSLEVVPTCDYVAVLPLEWKPAPIEHFMSDVGELLLTYRKKNELTKNGWREIAVLPFHSTDNNKGELVLLDNLSKRK